MKIKKGVLRLNNPLDEKLKGKLKPVYKETPQLVKERVTLTLHSLPRKKEQKFRYITASMKYILSTAVCLLLFLGTVNYFLLNNNTEKVQHASKLQEVNDLDSTSKIIEKYPSAKKNFNKLSVETQKKVKLPQLLPFKVERVDTFTTSVNTEEIFDIIYYSSQREMISIKIHKHDATVDEGDNKVVKLADGSKGVWINESMLRWTKENTTYVVSGKKNNENYSRSQILEIANSMK
jgi:hypothetical protein